MEQDTKLILQHPLRKAQLRYHTAKAGTQPMYVGVPEHDAFAELHAAEEELINEAQSYLSTQPQWSEHVASAFTRGRANFSFRHKLIDICLQA